MAAPFDAPATPPTGRNAMLSRWVTILGIAAIVVVVGYRVVFPGPKLLDTVTSPDGRYELQALEQPPRMGATGPYLYMLHLVDLQTRLPLDGEPFTTPPLDQRVTRVDTFWSDEGVTVQLGAQISLLGRIDAGRQVWQQRQP
jgi:hypothetical protein